MILNSLKHPSNWRVADLENDQRWVFRIDESARQEMIDAVLKAEDPNKSLLDYRRADFALSKTLVTLGAALEEVKRGLGVALIKGLPRRELTAKQFEIQQTLNNLFGKCEFGVADSGETALVQLEFGDFDLVLIELQLPGMDGIETTRRIRTHSKSKLHKLIVIGLGNSMLAPQRKICLDAGMQWVLFRPWTMDTLFRALKAQLG